MTAYAFPIYILSNKQTNSQKHHYMKINGERKSLKTVRCTLHLYTSHCKFQLQQGNDCKMLICAPTYHVSPSLKGSNRISKICFLRTSGNANEIHLNTPQILGGNKLHSLLFRCCHMVSLQTFLPPRSFGCYCAGPGIESVIYFVISASYYAHTPKRFIIFVQWLHEFNELGECIIASSVKFRVLVFNTSSILGTHFQYP